jgi:hypothetical protein
MGQEEEEEEKEEAMEGGRRRKAKMMDRAKSKRPVGFEKELWRRRMAAGTEEEANGKKGVDWAKTQNWSKGAEEIGRTDVKEFIEGKWGKQQKKMMIRRRKNGKEDGGWVGICELRRNGRGRTGKRSLSRIAHGGGHSRAPWRFQLMGKVEGA